MWICTNTLTLDRNPRVQAFTLPVCTCSHYLGPKTLTRVLKIQRGSKPYNRGFKT
ncbi:hypothetical protein HanIR_Chr13g0620031 [Helianthus annuus]|nr:hypothetical protein HanIR_Chr13g0620031 [Helianthus annuus]